MTRRLRVHVPGGFYHVTLRGNHRQPLFFSAADRDLLDDIVMEAVAKSGTRIHAYCWMTNHLHLLMQVSDAPLGRAVLRIASCYARKVQLHLETTGHLFERRYHSVIVDADRYLLTLIRYIHLNPVRAGLVSNALEYRWSSHRKYVGLPGPDWVTTDFALNLLHPTKTGAIWRYHELMAVAQNVRWGSGELQLNANNKDVLGDDEFAARVSGNCWRPRSRKSLDDLVVECCRRFAITTEQLVSRARVRELARARAWLTHEAVAGRIATVSAVARRLDRTEGALRQLLLRYSRSHGGDC